MKRIIALKLIVLLRTAMIMAFAAMAIAFGASASHSPLDIILVTLAIASIA